MSEASKFKYPPNPTCKHCRGLGTRLKDGVEWNCICRFVKHDASDELGSLLGQYAREALKRLNEIDKTRSKK